MLEQSTLYDNDTILLELLGEYLRSKNLFQTAETLQKELGILKADFQICFTKHFQLELFYATVPLEKNQKILFSSLFRYFFIFETQSNPTLFFLNTFR
jgi:hypothetical protein